MINFGSHCLHCKSSPYLYHNSRDNKLHEFAFLLFSESFCACSIFFLSGVAFLYQGLFLLDRFLIYNVSILDARTTLEEDYIAFLLPAPQNVPIVLNKF